MPRQLTTYQFDLFSCLNSKKGPVIPEWRELPEENRQALTALIVRLLIDHASAASDSQQREAGHDA